MLQNCFVLFKSFFDNNSFNYRTDNYNVVQFQSFENSIMNHHDQLVPHIHNNSACHFPSLTYYRKYERNLIFRINNENIYSKCTIPVFYCRNCRSYHALLPYVFIIPYHQYSLGFVISVLSDRFHNRLTVEDIVIKYDISKNTLYRWIEAYKVYYRIFITLHNRKNMNLFVALNDDFIDTIDSLFSITCNALFQNNRRLFNHSD